MRYCSIILICELSGKLSISKSLYDIQEDQKISIQQLDFQQFFFY